METQQVLRCYCCQFSKDAETVSAPLIPWVFGVVILVVVVVVVVV